MGKTLTNMEREEAIEVIKELQPNDRLREALRTLIPELAENEDEIIRKKILAEYKDRLAIASIEYKNPLCNKEIVDFLEKAIAYLERQKALSELDKYIAAKRTKPGFMFNGNDSVSWEELPLDVRKHDYPYYFIGDLDCYPFVTKKHKEQPMPDSTELDERWKQEKAMLKEKDFRGNEWRLAYNAYLDGFAYGVSIKQKAQPKEELVYRLNGLMQDYIKEGKDEEEKEHRFKCYQLFWDALEDTEFFEQKEQRPQDQCVDVIKMSAWLAADRLASAEMTGRLKERKEILENPEKYGLCKPAEWAALQKAFVNSKKDYTLEEKCDASDYADTILPTSVTYGENDEEYKLHKIIEAAFIAGQKKGQKPAEWSEEDEKMLNDILTCGERHCYLDAGNIAWLKSLRSRPKSSDNWKPSNEQMEALKYAIKILGYMKAANTLRELSIDLKKL